MPITNYSFTVKFGMTQNVGDYSNVRPELEVTLSGNGSAEEALGYMDQMFEKLQKSVHNVTDKELEYHDQDILYSEDDTFTLVNAADFDFLAMVPGHEDFPGEWGSFTEHGFRDLRYENMLRKIKKHRKLSAHLEELKIIRMSDLPDIERYTYLKIPSRHELILASGNLSTRYHYSRESNPIPKRWYDLADKEQGTCVMMPRDLFFENMDNLAADEGLTIINCLDEDFSLLPDLLPERKPEPEPMEEPDDIPFDDDEDEYDDDYDEDDDE